MSISFYWIDPAAGEIQLGESSTSNVKAYSGLGMAPLEQFLQGIPSQHRQLRRGMKFRPRIVQLGIWDRQVTAVAQDTRHQTLLAALNPARGEGTLKIVLNDGVTERHLDCSIQDGPDFASEDRPGWDRLQFYVARLEAANPFLYDPTPESESGNFKGATPVDIEVDNDGHVDTFPVLTITGAVNNPKVMLLTTGEYVEFGYNLTAGHHLDIDCGEGTVNYDDVAMSPLTLTKQSTLFCIPSGAAQTLRLTATSGTGAFSCTFYNRFLGL